MDVKLKASIWLNFSILNKGKNPRINLRFVGSEAYANQRLCLKKKKIQHVEIKLVTKVSICKIEKTLKNI